MKRLMILNHNLVFNDIVSLQVDAATWAFLLRQILQTADAQISQCWDRHQHKII